MLENKIAINHLVFDTRVAAYLLDAAYGDYALESLAAQHLGIAIKDNPVLVPSVIFRLYEIFRPQLESAGMEKLFCDIEMPLVSILKDMQDAGVKIDIAAMEKLLGTIDHKIDYVSKKIFALAKKEYQEAIIREPVSFVYFQRLGSVFSNLGDFNAADQMFQNALYLDPNNLGTNFFLAQYYSDRGDTEKFNFYLDKTAQLYRSVKFAPLIRTSIEKFFKKIGKGDILEK